MKSYVKPTIEVVQLRAEERLAGTACHRTILIHKVDGNCGRDIYYQS